MKAGILAAGDGSRLAAAGILTPKPLIKIGGVSLIERTLRSLVLSGADEIAFVVNERMECVVEAVRALRLPVPVHPVIQTTASSMHSLRALVPYLMDDRFVLCTVDSVMRDSEFCDFVQLNSVRGDVDVLLSYTDFVDDENPLRIGLDGQERVLALGAQASASSFVTLGLYGMSPSIFRCSIEWSQKASCACAISWRACWRQDFAFMAAASAKVSTWIGRSTCKSPKPSCWNKERYRETRGDTSQCHVLAWRACRE